MIKNQKRPLYSQLAPYYDFIAPQTTEQECMFLNNVFQNAKYDIRKILDIACGTGRHSCILNRMGYEVTGIDIAEEMLKIAKKKCPEVNFKKMDFLKLKFPKNTFDASIIMWSTISYIKSRKDFRTFIKGIAYITKNLLVIDSSNYENPDINKLTTKRIYNLKLPDIEIKSSLKRRYNPKTKFRNDEFDKIIKIKGNKPISVKEKEKARMWTVGEIETLIQTDFKVSKIYGDYSLDNKYKPEVSKRKIIITEKVTNKSK